MWAAESGVPIGTTHDLVVLTDIFYALTGDAHPLAPKPEAPAKVSEVSRKVAALEAQRARIAKERGGP